MARVEQSTNFFQGHLTWGATLGKKMLPGLYSTKRMQGWDKGSGQEEGRSPCGLQGWKSAAQDS